MILSKLAELVEKALYNEAPKAIYEACGNYYQPYYYLFYLLANEVREGSVVELGTGEGRGIYSFALGGLRPVGNGPNIKVIGLDLNVKPKHTLSNIDFHLISALPVPDFIEDIVILHIDTEHSYSNALNEFMQYKCKLLPGSVVMFDDLHAMNNGVLQAFYELPYTKIQCDDLHPGNGYGVLIYEDE